MAFVRMSNLLGTTIRVPSGAVRAYEGLGFALVETVAVEAVKEAHKNDDAKEDVQMTGDERFAQELEKKPVSQWNKDEVKRYASIFDIDISGTKSVQEAKERIKTFIDEKAV